MKRETMFFFGREIPIQVSPRKWIFNRNNRVEEVDRDPLGINCGPSTSLLFVVVFHPMFSLGSENTRLAS